MMAVNLQKFTENLMKQFLVLVLTTKLTLLSIPAYASFHHSLDDINRHINRCYKQTLLAADEQTLTQASTVSCSLLINSRQLPKKQQANTLLNRAVVNLYKGHDEKALQDFSRALLLNPKLVHAHIGSAQILYGNGALKEALAHYENAMSIDDTNPSLKHNRDLIANDLLELKYSKLVMQKTKGEPIE